MEKPENQIETGTSSFSYIIDQENRRIYFSGDKDSVVEFMGKMKVIYYAFNEPEEYKKRYPRAVESETINTQSWLEGKRRTDSIQFTLQPFRLYVFPEPTKEFSSFSKKIWERLRTEEDAQDSDWAVIMLENHIPNDDEDAETQWQEMLRQFNYLNDEISGE